MNDRPSLRWHWRPDRGWDAGEFPAVKSNDLSSIYYWTVDASKAEKAMMVTIHYERYYGRMVKEWTQNNGISHLAGIRWVWKDDSGEFALVCCWQVLSLGHEDRRALRFLPWMVYLCGGTSSHLTVQEQDLEANRNESPIMKCREGTKKRSSFLYLCWVATCFVCWHNHRCRRPLLRG